MTDREWILLGALGVLAAVIGGKQAVSYLGRLSTPQLLTLASSAGFTGDDLTTAVAVALAESSGDPNALGDIDVPIAGSASYGLWQVNSYWHPEYGPDFTRLYDPPTNASAAFAIYRAAGGFSPWTTFKNGAYAAYISQVQSLEA